MPSAKEECSGSQSVFKAEVAKIITKVWEENQGVARPDGAWAGPTVDGDSMPEPAKLQPCKAMGWEGRPHSQGHPKRMG